MGGLFGAVSKQDITADLFFGIDYHTHLGARRGGMAVIILWTVVTITIAFLVLKKTIGLRVTKEEEILIFPFTGFEVIDWETTTFDYNDKETEGTCFYFKFSQSYYDKIKEEYDE